MKKEKKFCLANENMNDFQCEEVTQPNDEFINDSTMNTK